MANGKRNLKRYKDEQTIRLRPAPTFGTNDEFGAARSVEELIDNSADEAAEGFGDRINVVFESDGTVEVTDSGRGLPMDWNEEESMYNWELALCTLYASGKYDNDQYGDSTGLNGLGLTASQFASDFMDVWSTYDGLTRHMHFEKGKPIGDMQITPAEKGVSGTKIRFRPDPIVFPALAKVSMPIEYFINLGRKEAMLIPGLHVHMEHYDLPNNLDFKFDGGIAEFIDTAIQQPAIKESVSFMASQEGTDDPEKYPETYTTHMSLAFNFSRESAMLEVYHNRALLFSKTNNYTADALKKGFTAAFNHHMIEIGKLNKTDKITFKDIESILVCIASTTAPGDRTWFRHQTKEAINNTFIAESLANFVYASVRGWLANSKSVSDKVVAEVLLNKQAREEADKVSRKIVSKLSKPMGFGGYPEKFINCECNDPSIAEIFFVEGDSAGGSVLTARAGYYQAIMACRGKPINCLKNTMLRSLSNDIVVDLFTCLGCGIEAKGELADKLPPFDINKLRWRRIIILADADLDGMHIVCLLITMFYVLAPSLLKAGKVYVAMTPLYEISNRKESRFAFNEDEKEKVIESFVSEGVSRSSLKIQRSKGLGENDPDMMWNSTLNPETRKIVRVDYGENVEEIAYYFQALLGDDIESRKMLIERYFNLTDEVVE